MLLDLLATIDSGKGNLSANAFLAARVGPLRVSHGSRSNVPIPQNGGAVLIAMNPGSSGQAIYVGVGLEMGASPVGVSFGPADITTNATIPGAMSPAFSVGSGISFSAVLLPGEELFAWTRDANVRLVVSQVGF